MTQILLNPAPLGLAARAPFATAASAELATASDAAAPQATLPLARILVGLPVVLVGLALLAGLVWFGGQGVAELGDQVGHLTQYLQDAATKLIAAPHLLVG